MDGLLSDLVKLVESLRAKINNESGINNEAITRYALIDPVLRGLGWDTEDPNVVVPEYNTDVGMADYALFTDKGVPTVIIEAKKLGAPLESAAEQGIHYCMGKGIEYFAVTDGCMWRVYETHKRAPTHEKLIQQFDINHMKPAEVCVNMLVLWRRNMSMQDAAVPKTSHAQHTYGQSAPRGGMKSTASSPAQASWKSLSNLTYAKGDSSPSQMKFPDGTTENIRSWVDVLVKTATWLIEGNHITKDSCPIKGGREWFLVATKAIHNNKKPFQQGRKIGRLYLECNYSPQGVLAMSKLLVNNANLDPRNFELEA